MKIMSKKNLDWANIGFGYMVADKRYVSNFKDGKWDDGCLTEDSKVVLSEDSGVLHYAQECFEGLKAYETEDGRLLHSDLTSMLREWLIQPRDLRCLLSLKTDLSRL